MIVVRHIGDLDLPRHGAVGLVPTMGALHGGHDALFAAARPASDVVVASLFVNPTQFSDDADLSRYPRDFDADAARAEAAGVDVLFAPPADEMYPAGFATWVDPEGAAEGLEGAHRPGHFRGVATVCLKLFNIVRPQAAWFGRKDAQQVAVLKQLVRDLNLDVAINVVETVRDRRRARALVAQRTTDAPTSAPRRSRSRARSRPVTPFEPREILAAAGLEPDYVTVADLDGPTLAVATRVGRTRLIDNVLLKGAS